MPLDGHDDVHSDVIVRGNRKREEANTITTEEAIPPIADIPITQINKLLYQRNISNGHSTSTTSTSSAPTLHKQHHLHDNMLSPSSRMINSSSSNRQRKQIKPANP